MDKFSFIERVLHAFKKINQEISIDSLEHDFSPRFVDHFVKEVLGYQGDDYKFERGRTDITLHDENKRRVVVIETKRPKESMDAGKWQEQAGKYADTSTLFVGLTNGYRFLLWHINKNGRELKVDLDLKMIVDAKRMSEDKLTTKETEQILYLNNLTKEQIWGSEKYSKFDDYYAKIDVADEEGFTKLIEHLNYISNDLLRQYTYSAFDEYYAGYAQYKQTMDDLEKLKRVASGSYGCVNYSSLIINVQSLGYLPSQNWLVIAICCHFSVPIFLKVVLHGKLFPLPFCPRPPRPRPQPCPQVPKTQSLRTGSRKRPAPPELLFFPDHLPSLRMPNP